MTSKEILRQIVIQQKKDTLPSEGAIIREILDDISVWFKDNRIIILTGLRRSGKSTLLRQIMANKKDFCYVNFEDERFLDFRAQDFEELNEVLIEIYGNPKIYFFDEIQNIENFESFVRRLQDHGKKIVITGSNASLLSKEFGTKLTGRYKSFEVYPFSFREFLAFNKIEPEREWIYNPEKKVSLIKFFAEYLSTGGMPEYLKNRDKDYIKTLYENILYRDIIARYSIKRQKLVKELVNIFSTNISSKFTYNSLKKTLGLSNAITVKEYISYMSNSYLFFELQKFDFSVKRQLNSPKKIYIIDPAFNRISGFNFSENKGKILENMVFIELKRRGMDVYYYSGENECDFLLKDGPKISGAIQVCHILSKDNKEREIGGLIEVMEKFNLREGLILTTDQEEEINLKSGKIKVMPAWKWLIARK
jgi:hypothetical protein